MFFSVHHTGRALSINFLDSKSFTPDNNPGGVPLPSSSSYFTEDNAEM